MVTYSRLNNICKQYGIKLQNEDGTYRHVVDVLEDLYLKTNALNVMQMFHDISEEELTDNLFDDARGRPYKSAEDYYGN